MKIYAVGCIKPLDSEMKDNNLVVENIRAINWVEALKKHSLLKKDTLEIQALFKNANITDSETLKEKAYHNNWMFEVIEIIEPLRAIELIEFC